MASFFHHPYFEVGVDGLQPFLVSLALSLVALAAFSTMGRVVIGSKRGVGWTGQALSVVATLLALAHTIVLIHACAAGLGKKGDDLPLGTSHRRQQLRYTMALLSTAAMSSAKGSAAAVIYHILGNIHKRTRYTLFTATMAFAIFSTFATAFECSGNAPDYWMYTPQACNHGGLEYAIVVFNIITDSWLAFAALPIVWRLQTVLSRRLRVMALLGARVIVVAAELAQLVSLAQYLNIMHERAWNEAIVVSYTVVVMELSIICANLPFLSTWLDELISGQNGAHITARDTGYDLTDLSYRSQPFSTKVRSRNQPSNEPASHVAMPVQADAESDHGSQTGILKTVAVRLDYDKSDQPTTAQEDAARVHKTPT